MDDGSAGEAQAAGSGAAFLQLFSNADGLGKAMLADAVVCEKNTCPPYPLSSLKPKIASENAATNGRSSSRCAVALCD